MADEEDSAAGAAALALAERIGARLDAKMQEDLRNITVKQLAGLYDAFKSQPAADNGGELAMSPTLRLRKLLGAAVTPPPKRGEGWRKGVTPDMRRIWEHVTTSTDYNEQLSDARTKLAGFAEEVARHEGERAQFRMRRATYRQALRRARLERYGAFCMHAATSPGNSPHGSSRRSISRSITPPRGTPGGPSLATTAHVDPAADGEVADGGHRDCAGGGVPPPGGSTSGEMHDDVLTGDEGCPPEWCPPPTLPQTLALYKSIPAASLALLRQLWLRAADASDYDNVDAENDTEWWREPHCVRDYERHRKDGCLWQAVMAGAVDAATGAPIVAAEAELTMRSEYYQSMVWWQREQYRREWLLTADAEWWTVKDVYEDYRRGGHMWLRDVPDVEQRALRRAWYETHLPVVKKWAAAVEGDVEPADDEDLEERVDWYWCGGWWTGMAAQEEFALLGTDAPALAQLHEVATSEPLEDWQSLLFLNLYFAELATDPSLAENKKTLRCFAGLDTAFPETCDQIIALRSDYYDTYWWRQECMVVSYRARGSEWKREAPHSLIHAEYRVVQQRAEWYESLATEWWQQPFCVDAYFQAKELGVEALYIWSQRSGWQAVAQGPADAMSPLASKGVDLAERQRREAWFQENWWRQRKYVESFYLEGVDALWRAADAVPWATRAPWWAHPVFAGDYYRHPEGGRWCAFTQEAAVAADGWRKYPCSTRDRALRMQYYDAVYPVGDGVDGAAADGTPLVSPPPAAPASRRPWWQRQEFVDDYHLNGDDGGAWCARTLAAAWLKCGWRSDPCSEAEREERRAYYSGLPEAGDAAGMPTTPAPAGTTAPPASHPVHRKDLDEDAVRAVLADIAAANVFDVVEAEAEAAPGDGGDDATAEPSPRRRDVAASMRRRSSVKPKAAAHEVLAGRVDWYSGQLKDAEAMRRIDWYTKTAAGAPRILLEELPALLTVINEDTPPAAYEFQGVIRYLKTRGRSALSSLSYLELFEAVVGTGYFLPLTKEELELHYQDEWERQVVADLRSREEEAVFQLDDMVRPRAEGDDSSDNEEDEETEADDEVA